MVAVIVLIVALVAMLGLFISYVVYSYKAYKRLYDRHISLLEENERLIKLSKDTIDLNEKLLGEVQKYLKQGIGK